MFTWPLERGGEGEEGRGEDRGGKEKGRVEEKGRGGERRKGRKEEGYEEKEERRGVKGRGSRCHSTVPQWLLRSVSLNNVANNDNVDFCT